MQIKEALELKAKMRKKRPKFTRQSSHKKKRLKLKWRRPKGLHSKMRLQFRGYKGIVKIGYGTPNQTKGINNRLGLKEKVVSCVKDLENIDNKTEGVIIARTIGLRNRIEIIKKSLEKSITIINIKKPEDFLKKVEEKIKSKKEEKTEKKKAREEKKKEREKKAKEKEKKEGEKDDEKSDKDDELSQKIEKEEKKKEVDKVLTKKE